MTSPTFRGMLWAPLVALAVVAGYLQIFTLFMLYDDEGYVLISLNNFAEGGGLYDQVYSQYGPLFYLVFGGLARVGGFAWTHDIGRFVTLGHWIGTTGVCAWICFQLTRSHLASALAFAGTFAHLWQMSAEPMHPGGALAFWVALGAGFSIKYLLARRITAFSVTVALAAACCALVKINAGLFIAAAGGMWMLLNRSHRGRWGKQLDWLIVAVAACGPAVLMFRSLGETWASIYALVGGVAIGSIGAWTVRDSRSDTGLSSILIAVAAGGGVVVGIALAIWLCGTTPTQLLHGSLIGPLSHAGVYHFPFDWRPGTVIGTLLSAIGCALLYRLKPSLRFPRYVIDALSILIVVIVILSGFSLPPGMLGLVMTTFGITVWWFVTFEGESRFPVHRARAWLALFTVWQFLYAYPVAGSQVGWGTFLWVPLAIVAIHSSYCRLSGTLTMTRIWLRKIVSWSVVIVAGAIVIGQLKAGLTYYKMSAPLDLPGARHLRVSPSLGSTIRVIARNAELGSESLFSLPGAFSFNLWTGLDTPTKTNVTHWFSLLEDAPQQAIADQLRLHQTPVIVQPGIVDTHLRDFIDRETPLFSYLERDYESRIEVGLLALWRQKDDLRPIVNIAEYYTAATASSSDSPAHFVSLMMELPSHEKVIAVELAVFEMEGLMPPSDQFWHHGNTALEARPISLEEQPDTTASFEPLTWPIAVSGLHEFRFYPAENLPSASYSRIWLRFRNAEGEVVAEARFVNETK